MSYRCDLMGIKPSRSKQLMVESDGSVFAKGLLGRDNKTFILHVAQYLSPADQ